ncbi:hypothetical protein, partial [Pseudomonas cerasi]
ARSQILIGVLRKNSRIPHHQLSSASTTALLCFSVGAGLPAMQAPRCVSDTLLMPSQASQLPHLIEFSLQRSGRLSGRLGFASTTQVGY